MGASGAQSTGYTIDQSIRFNDNDSAYMYRTPSGAGNRDKWTWSGWIKRGNISANLQMISAPLGSSAGYLAIQYGSLDQFMLYQWNGSSYDFDVRTTQKFRDPSAWYHYVVVYDSGNALSAERVKLYVNGQRITDLTGASGIVYPSQNADSYINNTVQHSIGYYTRPPSSGGQYFDGYMAELHFLDGYAYGPEYFGEFDENGIWIPKEYTGSYGTNGFKIDGRDSSDLGDDESGNGNDYTTSGLAANDQRADSPTNNHHTWASNHGYVDGGTQTFANGNLDYAVAAASWGAGQGTMGIPDSGKWTFAIKLTASLGGSSYPMFGIIDSLNQPVQDGIGLQYQSPTPANSMVFVNTYQNSTQAYFFKGGAASESVIGSAFAHGGATNGEWQWFINSDDKELTVYHNGTKRLDAYDISFLTFPLFLGVTSYAYSGTRLYNEPDTEYTPSISGYKAINSINIGEA